VRRDTINVVLCGLLAQITGFVKLLLIAHYFGVSPELDGYYLALAIPAVVQGFITSAVQTGFVPIYISLRSQGAIDEAHSLAVAVFHRLFLFLLFLSLALSLSSETIIVWLTPASSATVQQAAAISFKILAFSALANGLIDYFSLLLNAHHRYVAAALGPAINAVVSSLILFAWPEWGINNLIWGLMAGMLLQLLVALFACHKSGIKLDFFSRSLRHNALTRVYKLTLPILLGVALANANNTVIQFFSAMTGDGGVSTLGYASRLHVVFLQVVIMGVSAVLLPNFSGMVANGQNQQIHAVLQHTFRMSLLLGILMAIAIGSMGTDIVTLLLQRGRFDHEAAKNVSFIWLIYTLGLLPIAWGTFVAKYFQATQKPWVITRLAILSFASNTILAWLLLQSHGLPGLAAASGFSYLLVAIGYHRAVSRDLGQPILQGEIGRKAVVTLIGIVSWVAISYLQPLYAHLHLFVRLAGTSLLVLAAAVLMAWQAGLLRHLRRQAIPN